MMAPLSKRKFLLRSPFSAPTLKNFEEHIAQFASSTLHYANGYGTMRGRKAHQDQVQERIEVKTLEQLQARTSGLGNW